MVVIICIFINYKYFHLIKSNEFFSFLNSLISIKCLLNIHGILICCHDYSPFSSLTAIQ